MLSLGKIFQLIEEQNSHSQDENLAIEAIKKGFDLRSNTKEGQTFWDDFMKITGNAKALGHLLGIDPIQIMKWRERINKYYRKVLADRKNDELNKQKRNKMINTGNMPGNYNNQSNLGNYE